MFASDPKFAIVRDCAIGGRMYQGEREGVGESTNMKVTHLQMHKNMLVRINFYQSVLNSYMFTTSLSCAVEPAVRCRFFKSAREES